MREADYDRSDSLEATLPADERTPLVNVVGRSTASGDSIALKQALEELRNSTSDESYGAFWMALYEGGASTAERIVEILAESPETRAQAARLEAPLALALGRISTLRENVPGSPAGAAEYVQRIRLIAAMLPFQPVPDDELRAIRATVEAGDSVSDPNAAHTAQVLRGEQRLYLIASISCRLGEHDRALALAQRVEQAAVAPQYREITQRLAQEIRVQVAARQGNHQQALAILESVDPTSMLELRAAHIGGNYQPYWRAELLYQLGRDDEALQWLENGFAGNSVELFTFGYTNLRQGEIYERQGDGDAAAKHYAKAIAYWEDADPPLQAEVARARERLAALTQERAR